MNKIREYGLENVIYDVVDADKPFLGICLGLQLLFKTSEESPEATGLGSWTVRYSVYRMRRDLRYRR